ncbi:hypothetical protein ON010_g1964 [Phytophthora cinnamomi]|nr:hypothetical protein ON010_g1964 [Phytophthora cinnamomi]
MQEVSVDVLLVGLVRCTHHFGALVVQCRDFIGQVARGAVVGDEAVGRDGVHERLHRLRAARRAAEEQEVALGEVENSEE